MRWGCFCLNSSLKTLKERSLRSHESLSCPAPLWPRGLRRVERAVEAREQEPNELDRAVRMLPDREELARGELGSGRNPGEVDAMHPRPAFVDLQRRRLFDHQPRRLRGVEVGLVADLVEDPPEHLVQGVPVALRGTRDVPHPGPQRMIVRLAHQEHVIGSVGPLLHHRDRDPVGREDPRCGEVVVRRDPVLPVQGRVLTQKIDGVGELVEAIRELLLEFRDAFRLGLGHVHLRRNASRFCEKIKLPTGEWNDRVASWKVVG